MNATFCFTRLKGRERNWQPLGEYLAHSVFPPLASHDIRRWGIWSGVFGIGSNELVLMTSADAAVDHWTLLNNRIAAAPCAIVEQHLLRATVRPTDREPPTRPGLYVLRFFDVSNADVDEIARLSLEAWTTFETTDAYRAQPQGLFCQNDRNDARGIMLLCTWYDGLESWQTSRSPPAQAADNFRRRQQLTFGTIAYAANLVPASFGRANPGNS
jgi:hypothetical protein